MEEVKEETINEKRVKSICGVLLITTSIILVFAIIVISGNNKEEKEVFKDFLKTHYEYNCDIEDYNSDDVKDSINYEDYIRDISIDLELSKNDKIKSVNQVEATIKTQNEYGATASKDIECFIVKYHDSELDFDTYEVACYEER